MKKKVIFVVCCLLIAILILCFVLFKKQSNYNEFVNNRNNEKSNVELLVDKDLNNELDVNISNDIESLFDYYICLYIRCALSEYTEKSGDVGPFTVSEEFITYGNANSCSVTITSKSGVKMILYMDRLTDEYQLEIQ